MSGLILGRRSLGIVKKIQTFSWNDLLFVGDTTSDTVVDRFIPGQTLFNLQPYLQASSFRPDMCLIAPSIVNSTTIRSNVYNSPTGSVYATAAGQLIEFKNVIFKQAGSVISYGQTSTVVNFTKEINPNKTIIVPHMTSRFTSTTGAFKEVSVTIEDVSAYDVSFRHSGNIDRLFYQILEFK